MKLEFKNVKISEKTGNPIVGEVSVVRCGEYELNSVYTEIDINSLPAEICKNVNPRQSYFKDSKAVSEMSKTLSENDPTFLFRNKGMVVICEKIVYNKKSNSITVTMSKNEYEGLADGGHTFATIKSHAASNDIKPDLMYVPIKFIFGDKKSLMKYGRLISIGLNTAKKVSTVSIAEKENLYQIIKDAIENEPFVGRIVYESTASKGKIKISDIIKLMNIFCDIKTKAKYKPKTTSKTKEKILEDFHAAQKAAGADDVRHNQYLAMTSILVDILKLYDHVHFNLPIFGNEIVDWNDYNLNTSGKKFFDEDPGLTEFYEYRCELFNPTQFTNLMMLVFRCLATIDEDTGYYKWIVDPFKYFDKYGVEFAKILCHYFNEDNNHSPEATSNNRLLANELQDAAIIFRDRDVDERNKK